MRISVIYAKAARQAWHKFEVPEGTTVLQAIEQSGLLTQFPEIDLDRQQVGIFGKKAKLDAPLEDGARVEIWRPITADPETVERRDGPEA